MQPFGLLNFLQAALSPNGDNQPDTASKNETPTQEEPPIVESLSPPSKGEDAYQAFVSKHEQFAQKIRKKY